MVLDALCVHPDQNDPVLERGRRHLSADQFREAVAARRGAGRAEIEQELVPSGIGPAIAAVVGFEKRYRRLLEPDLLCVCRIGVEGDPLFLQVQGREAERKGGVDLSPVVEK